MGYWEITVHQIISDSVRSYKMESVNFIEIDLFGQTQTYAIIDRGNGEFTSMLKSTYDEMITQQEVTKPLL